MKTRKILAQVFVTLWISACTLTTQSGQSTQPVASIDPPESTRMPAMQVDSSPTESRQDSTPIPQVTSAASPVPLDQMIDPQFVAAVDWRQYTGQLGGSDKSDLLTFTLFYPSQWSITTHPSPEHFAVQNIPEQPGGGPVEGDFVKLEIVLVRGPLSEDLEAKEQLVEVHAEKATLRTTVVSPGQSLRLSLALEKEDVFYILAGYADLSNEDQVSLEEYRVLLLAMMASFALE